MGSDYSPSHFHEVFDATEKLLSPNDQLVVFALPEFLAALKADSSHAKIEWVSVEEEVTMGEDPLSAVRLKKKSSMAEGMRLLAQKKIDALLSSGNTGALIATAALMLPTLPGIKRPALLASLPTQKRPVAVLDVGANVVCKSEHLVQFAMMGSAYQQCMQDLSSPKVGLLNIGTEEGKGTALVKEAYGALQELGKNGSRVNFVGNVEGREVFHGQIDVLVTDGFTGNVFLKTSEGVGSFALEHIHAVMNKDPAFAHHPVLGKLQSFFDYTEYPGAVLCGVDGILIKCHGHSSAKAWINAIKGARKLIQHGLIKNIKQRLN